MPDRTRAAVRAVSSAALAAAALGALAACSSGSPAAGATSAPDATGTWTETGDYQTPGGQESVTVELTAKDGTVTAVTVTGSGGSPNSQRYQAQFISGIDQAVVGKPLATLEVGAVSGSSLTGRGFNAAVDKIRADAA
ncbi:FMN-binding protein [Amnibacterium endophyticum]|uniref:FMN-binding protein n=1 Tax=Amnibacterium endophyticum TaxID=2109337 RepID=A0ABW4LGZ2_9MICO